MTTNELKALCESLIFASGDPLDLAVASDKLLIPLEDLLSAAEQIQKEYSRSDKGFELVKIGDTKYQFTAKKQYEQKIREVLAVAKSGPLSPAAFEVLAVIAYNQPVTKSFVDQVRGVDCAGVISTLMKRKLIQECGRLDLPGRPLLYCTTDDFLRCFRISDVSQLPQPPKRDAEENELVEKTDTPGQISIEDI